MVANAAWYAPDSIVAGVPSTAMAPPRLRSAASCAPVFSCGEAGRAQLFQPAAQVRGEDLAEFFQRAEGFSRIVFVVPNVHPGRAGGHDDE